MGKFRRNLLAEFSLASLLIMLLLALALSLVLRYGLQDHLELLQGHGMAMMQGTLSPDNPYSMASIKAEAQELEWLSYVVVAAGFCLLYGSLVFIVWGGWRTIKRQELRFRGLIEGLGEGVVLVGADERIAYANREAVRLLGKDADRLVGRRWGQLFPRPLAQLPRAGADAAAEPVEMQLERREGGVAWVELRTTAVPETGTICAIADVTLRKHAERRLQDAHEQLEGKVEELQLAKRELQQANAQLEHDAFHDGLTGLANRALFMDRLGHVLERYRARGGRAFAVLYLDFDRFKIVNDSLGHHIGDQLLIAGARRLAACIRSLDTAARLGGDEFSILLEEVADLEEALEVVERLQQSFQAPVVVEGQELRISTSIGVVMSSDDYEAADDILRAADIAMYRAKALGKARYQVFDQAMYQRAMDMMRLERDLRGAIERDELEVHYLPIVELSSGRLTGFEALVRWRHPQHGMVSPAEFIPLAEETGMVIDIDRWVLREGCRQVKRWQEELGSPAPIDLSANLSAHHFLRPELVGEVRAVLAETGFDPRHLRLEITETVMVRQSPTVQAALEELKALGVELHLDDFGTGYSSLSYLHQLPADTLKIDRSFIDRMGSSPDSASLVQSILTMARNLGINVIAEGVETVEQLEQLKALDCRYAQGFLFSKPLAATDAEALLVAGQPFPLESEADPVE